MPDEALEEIAELAPNMDQLGVQAYVEAFQITLGVLVVVLLAALPVASFIPVVKTEEVTSLETNEMAADVSSRRT
jgi:presenilin-like A22 family membrane protease